MEQAVDVFRDISQASLEATVELVRGDKINILIDLMGFSSSGRPALFELKPVPIQMHNLGYPGKNSLNVLLERLWSFIFILTMMGLPAMYRYYWV